MPYLYTCAGCGRSYRTNHRKATYCPRCCRRGIPHASHSPHAPQESPEKLRTTLYHRDNELFSQRMSYTLNGITWWVTPCCYCGDPAEAEDHVLPLSALKKLAAVGNINIPQDLLRLVPSCHECNSLLGDKVFRSFEERRLYAKSSLAHRYHKALDYPHWTIDELETLTGNLRNWIAHGQDFRDLVFERLRF